MERDLYIIDQIMIATSALSMASSAYMIYSILICKDLLKRPSFQIFMNMAVSNLLAASGTVFGGTPPNGSGACWWQGLSTNVFPLATFFWNAALLLILYNSCKLHTTNMTVINIICWGIPTFVSLIPLADRITYGREDVEWCFLIPTPTSTVTDEMLAVWYWISFYMWVWLAFVMSTFILYYLNFNFIYSLSGPTKMLMSEKLRIIKYFPLVSLLSWGLINFTDTILMVAPELYVPQFVNFLSDALACLHGFVITVVFLYSTRRTRIAKVAPAKPKGPRIVEVHEPASGSDPNSTTPQFQNHQSVPAVTHQLSSSMLSSANHTPRSAIIVFPSSPNTVSYPSVHNKDHKRRRSFVKREKGSFYNDLNEEDLKKLQECINEEDSELEDGEHTQRDDVEANTAPGKKLEEMVINLLALF